MTEVDQPQLSTTMTIDQAIQRAVSHHSQGQLQDAERLYRAILQAQPNHPDANHNLGVLAVQVGRPELGLANLKTALDGNANVPQYWLSYAEALLKSGQARAAQSTLVLAAKAGVSGEKYETLKEQMRDAFGSLSHDPLAPALEHVRAGRKEEAQALLADHLLRAPNDGRALAQLGELLRHETGRLDEALSLLASAVKVDPNGAMQWLSYGSALRQAKRITEAKTAFSNVLRVNPNRVEALNDLGTIYLDEENWEKAAMLFGKACSMAPDVADILLNHAIALAQMGQVDKAEAAARKVQALGHGDRLGATMFLAKLGKEPMPERAPDSFLVTIYASRAKSWDKGSLTGEERYRGAELVATALDRLTSGKLDILDAGCGTGLVGGLIAHRARHLVGVDLSREMIEKALEKRLYQSLHLGDFVKYFEDHPSEYDVITCAATFIHFADLTGVFKAAAHTLRQNGLLIFTVFPNDNDPNGFGIGPVTGSAQGGLYEHGEGYIAKVAQATGFEVALLERHVHEYFNNQPKFGLVVALRRI